MAKAFCAANHIRHIVCRSEELEIDGFRQNPKNRCYLCKHELFEKIWAIAEAEGLGAVAEGSNLDDNGDYRPGVQRNRPLSMMTPEIAFPLPMMYLEDEWITTSAPRAIG